MNFRQLDYIVAIAKYQNISKAANEVYISQPSLSKYLHNLEDLLGIKLFSRINNKFVLTYAGERYIEHVKQILLIKKDLDDEISDIAKSNKGRLRIAFPLIRGSYMIPATLPSFMDKYPNVKIILHEQPSEVLEKLLLNGDADLAIFNHPIKDPGLDYEVLRNEEIVLAISKKHHLADKGIPREGCRYNWIDITELENEKFILHKPDQRTGQVARQLFSRFRINPTVVLETRSIEGALRLAASNFGICFVGETHLNHIYLEDKPSYFSVGDPNTTVQLVAAYRNGSYLPKYTRDYIQIIKKSLLKTC